MSLWTPGGEVPVNRDDPARRTRRSDGPSEPGRPGDPGDQSVRAALSDEVLAEAAAAAGIDIDQLSPEERAQLEAMLLEMAEAQARLASTPAAEVLVNHLGGIYELARIHLSQDPPHFDEAALAIDALAAVLDALEPTASAPTDRPCATPSTRCRSPSCSSAARPTGRWPPPSSRVRPGGWRRPRSGRGGPARPRRRPRRADLDGARAVGDGRAVEEPLAPSRRRRPPCRSRRPRRTRRPGPRRCPRRARPCRRHQWTILAIGSSMMSVAPWSRRAGIRMLMSALGTTVSTA